MKVGIIGSGFVGSTAAYTLFMQRIASEIVLVDIDKKRAAAEASDILHAVPYVHTAHVTAGDYADIHGSTVVIVTAGVSQKPGESRLQLLERNATVFQRVIPAILEHAPKAILLIGTNPVDIMTHLAAHFAAEYDVPPERVIGSGTILDTARFRAILGTHLCVDPQHIHGYVIGEHGDSEVLTWSAVEIGRQPLKQFARLCGIEFENKTQQVIDQEVRSAAYRIIEGKGATYYGIGAALAYMVRVILYNHHSIMTVSTPADEIAGVKDVTVSLPRIVTGSGITATIPLALSEQETEALHQSTVTVRKAIEELNF